MTTGLEAKPIANTIAIIGGGVSAALTAYHLNRQNIPARIVIIDSREELGLGVAYSTPSLRHLLNVPAGKISALPNDPHHFLEWLRVNYDKGATATTFAPRAIFGRYVQSLLVGTQGIEHLRASVVDYRAQPDGASLLLSDGRKLHADLTVLATGNFDPAMLSGIPEEAFSSGAYRHNAWLPDTFDSLDTAAPIALIGTGLTAVDVLQRLRELGHRGIITAISRHGVFPNRHAAYIPLRAAAIPLDTPPTCIDYLRTFRLAIRDGAEWRAVVDSLRSTTNDLWLALPRNEQRRFRRHLQRRWDVVRHRMAPSVADTVDAELAAGTLIIREGHFASVEAMGAGAIVTMRIGQRIERLISARVINCTGPSMNYRKVNSPLLHSLFSQGIASAGPLGGGLNCSEEGALIGENGLASKRLFNLGPGRLGTLLESIAIPEIREQVVQLAEILTQRITTKAAQNEPVCAFTQMTAYSGREVAA
jgi:uncharacterized NAD(P)/FAD-binding protein YdhS